MSARENAQRGTYVRMSWPEDCDVVWVWEENANVPRHNLGAQKLVHEIKGTYVLYKNLEIEAKVRTSKVCTKIVLFHTFVISQ